MNLLERLINIDRRIIFIIIALAVIIPQLFPLGLPIHVSPPVQRVYDYIEDLPEGSVIMIAFDFGPASMPELYPMSLAILRHSYSRKLMVIGIALWPTGAALGELAMSEVAEELGSEEWEDYVNLGYKPGGLSVLLGLGENIAEVFPADYSNKPLSEIPMMKDIKNYDNVALMVDLAAGETVEYWITYAGARYNQTIAAGCTAVMAADLYPWLDTGQLIGLIGGLKGAAEYEKLTEKPAMAMAGMDSQTIVHIAIVVLVIFGNTAYFIIRKRGQSQETA